MPVTYEELKSMLDVDEPNYPALATAAADAMPLLKRMAASDDVALASKAVSLAGVIGSAASVDVVADAAKARDARVRIAAAHAAAHLPSSSAAASVVSRLLADSDIGVVKLAARAAVGQGDRVVAATVKDAQARIAAVQPAAATPRRRPVVAKKATDPAAAPAAKKKPAAKPARAATAGGMPTGKMANPTKAARAAAMPTGTMT